MEQKELRKKLLAEPKNGYDRLTKQDAEQLEAYCKDYMRFLDASKTERECVVSAIKLAETKGFAAFDEQKQYHSGDKIYYNDREKGIILAVIGSESLASGAVIAGAHTDAPRLDLKPTPLYEDGEFAQFKTHYYGGIRKYQWLNVPLCLHGTIVRKDGTKLFLTIGDKPDDPQFIINDLLPHLGREQGKKPLNEAIIAENLNLLVGGRPLAEDDGKNRFKLEVLRLLNEQYGITEDDFISAELQAVPAMNAREIGVDRSFIAAYGQDDRVCAYAELAALLSLDTPRRTAVCIFSDKEEIGSEGVTGMQSACFDRFMGKLCKQQGVSLEDCYAHSFCLSADVTAAFDPNFAEVFDTHSCARCNHGIGLVKYTGAAGKSGASDASAEVVAMVRKAFDEKGVLWQIGEMGKADAGGGGTIAKFMARRNIDTIDAGVPVLGMHSPYETTAKLDGYMTYLGVCALFAL